MKTVDRRAEALELDAMPREPEFVRCAAGAIARARMKVAGFVDPRLVAAFVLLAVLGGLTIWALLERSALAKKEGELQQFKDAYSVLADQAKRQSSAVADLEAKGAAARAAGRQAAIAAAAEAKLKQEEIDALKAAQAAPTPAGEGCHEALQKIRGLL